MVQFISLEDREALFSDDDPQITRWTGDLFQIPDQGEVIPFRFNQTRYVVFFMSPLAFAGDQPTLEEWAPNFSDGFVPHPDARLIKFFRAEAEEDEFKEKAWPLGRPTEIFRFCNHLADVVSLHADINVGIKQYFYIAASPRLAMLYKRIFKGVKEANSCALAQFEPILASTGEYDGYQR